MIEPIRYALCLDNRGHEVSLDIRKAYQIIPDAKSESQELLRIVDETGEDYLYQATRFLSVEVPVSVQEIWNSDKRAA